LPHNLNQGSQHAVQPGGTNPNQYAAFTRAESNRPPCIVNFFGAKVD